MSQRIQFRRGTTTQLGTIIPANGEPIMTTDTKRLVIGDGTTVGGIYVDQTTMTMFTAYTATQAKTTAGIINSLGNSDNSFAFRFKCETVLNSLITFSRASTATNVNNTTGLVNSVGTNVPRLSGRQELWKVGSKNLIPYSNDLINAAWNLKTATASVAGEANRISFSAGDSYYGMFVNLAAGSTYTISAKVKQDGASSAGIKIQFNAISQALPVTSDWTTVQYTNVFSSGSNYFAFRSGDGNAGSVLIKEIQLELAATATTYEPNPVVIQPGLLIEGQATNVNQSSGGYTGWNNDSTNTWTQNAGTAPDGANTATHITGGGYIYRTETGITTGQPYVLSVWLKCASAGNLILRIGSNQSPAVACAADGIWKRYYFTSSFASTGLFALDSIPPDAYVWGIQLETGTIPSSHIPTSGSSVTRAIDDALVDISKIGNSSEGTLIIEADAETLLYLTDRELFDTTSAGMEASKRVLCRVVANSNTLRIYFWNGGFLGAIDIPISSNRIRLAIRYSSSGSAYSVNGSAVAYSTFQWPTTNTFYPGRHVSDIEQLNGTIQSLQYLPYALDDSTLQVISNIT